MKYIKTYETLINKQEPFYLSKSGEYLYLSDDFVKSITPSLHELKKQYNKEIANRIYNDQLSFLSKEKNERGFNKIKRLNIQIHMGYGANRYRMDMIIFNNHSNNYNYYLGGNSGDHDMHGKNMKRATRECNLKFMIKFYPIVAKIKNFYKKFQNQDRTFFEIIKDEIDKDIMLAQYGIPKEIKHLFDDDLEDMVINSKIYNL